MKRFVTTIFSATHRCNVETMLELFETMLQRCVALKIVVANRSSQVTSPLKVSHLFLSFYF